MSAGGIKSLFTVKQQPKLLKLYKYKTSITENVYTSVEIIYLLGTDDDIID